MGASSAPSANSLASKVFTIQFLEQTLHRALYLLSDPYHAILIYLDTKAHMLAMLSPGMEFRPVHDAQSFL